MRKRQSKAHRSAGFTLIELMVTLALVMVLALVGVPSLLQFINQNRLTSTAYLMRDTHTFARQEALKRLRTITICPLAQATGGCDSKSWNQGLLVYLDNDGVKGFDASVDRLLKRSIFPQSMNIAWNNGARISLFESGGSTAGTFVLTSGTTIKKLVISPIGRIRTE